MSSTIGRAAFRASRPHQASFRASRPLRAAGSEALESKGTEEGQDIGKSVLKSGARKDPELYVRKFPTTSSKAILQLCSGLLTRYLAFSDSF